MFRFIYNVNSTVISSVLFIILAIITGKMPKISVYHFDKGSHFNDLFDICSDTYIKTNSSKNVSDDCKMFIINEFIDYLHKQEEFKNVVSSINFPIFDGKEVIGDKGFYTTITEINGARFPTKN
jgi:hypothetical protein